MRTHSDRIESKDANALRSECEGNAPSLQSPIPVSNPISRVGERTRGARLPTDWPLTAERRATAEVEKLDADRTFAKFSDYWRAATGRTATKRDWDATWRNWCRTEADRKPLNGSGVHVTKFDRIQASTPKGRTNEHGQPIDEAGDVIPF